MMSHSPSRKTRPAPLIAFPALLALLAAAVLAACQRDYDNPFDPESDNYAGEDWTRDGDGDGIADSVEVYAPHCTSGPDSCLAQARRNRDILAALQNGNGGEENGNGTDSGAKPPDSIQVADMTLTEGDPAAEPRITWYPSTAADKRYSLISDNASVAKVEGGKIRPMASGSAVVTVITESGRRVETFKVTVKTKNKPTDNPVVRVSSVTALPVFLLVGEEKDPVLTWNPGNATDKSYSLASQDASKAEIRGGKVYGKSAGVTAVTVTARDGGKTATFTVTVQEKDTRVRVQSLAAGDTVIALGQEAEPRIEWAPADATDRSYKLMSSEPSVVSVQGSRLRADAPGVSVVMIQANDDPSKAVAIKVRVVIPLGSVSAADMALTVGEAPRAPSVTYLPAQATDRRYRLASDNAAVAAVEKDTLVRAVAAGTATLTLTSLDGNRTHAFQVTVSDKVIPVQSVSAPDMAFVTGDAARAPAVAFTPGDASDQRFRLSSDNAAVAEIEGGTSVKPVAAGTCNVTITSEDGGRTGTFKVSVSDRVIAVEAVSAGDMAFTAGDPARAPEVAFTPADATDRRFRLVTDNAAVAAIEGETQVRPLGSGSANVTVISTDGGKRATFKVTVSARVIPVSSIDVKDMTLETGSPDQAPEITWNPGDATDKGYSLAGPSDPDPAASAVDGKVHPLRAGTAVFQVIPSGGGSASNFTVTVVARVQGIAAADMDVAEDTRGHVPVLTWTPADATDKAYALASSDTDKVSVQGGTRLFAKKPGQSTVTVTTRDGNLTAAFAVRVFQPRCLELFAAPPADAEGQAHADCCRATFMTCPDSGGPGGGGDGTADGEASGAAASP